MALAIESWRGPSSRENRGASRPILPASWGCTRQPSAQAEVSVPLQGSLLPHVNETHEQNQHEHEHLAEAEERQLPAGADIGDLDERHRAGQLPVEHAPRDHEDGLDVEDDEQHRDHVELDREAFSRVTERWDA